MRKPVFLLITIITLSVAGLSFAVYLLYSTLVPACVTDSQDRFLLQSADVRIEEGLLKNKVKVLVFWKADHAASQSALQFIDSISLANDYDNRPVAVIAVHSEEETKAYFEWWKNHPWNYGMYEFHDSHACMKANYRITEYPQILIFDEKDNLIVKDADLASVQSMVETLLN